METYEEFIKEAIKKELKKDIKKHRLNDTYEITEFFYINYISFEKNFRDEQNYKFMKASDSYTPIDDRKDFNKKINQLLDHNYIYDEIILNNLNLTENDFIIYQKEQLTIQLEKLEQDIKLRNQEDKQEEKQKQKFKI